MTNKLIDNKRRNHAAKVLQQMSKAQQSHESHDSSAPEAEVQTETETSLMSMLREQYGVIREDLMKLREDLSHSYDVAKGMLDRKTIMKELKRLR